MSDEKRSYRKRKRADLEEQTHLKITESAVALHGTVGPARTTISAIAEHAGVRRSTVYRHFPDDAALYAACSSHWLQLNPLPDPLRWAEIDVMQERRRTVLLDLYAYYRSSAEMLRNILRDEADIPALQAVMGGLHAYFGRVGELLSGPVPDSARLDAAIRHALSFFTWSSLALDGGLGDRDCAELMSALIELAEAPAPRDSAG